MLYKTPRAAVTAQPLTRPTRISALVVVFICLGALVLGGSWLPGEAVAEPSDVAPQAYAAYSDNWRIGVGVAREQGYINEYASNQLCAGWYQDWGTLLEPPRPNGIEYMQLVRVNPRFFNLSAPPNYGFNWADLNRKILANPGSVWMIGNEPDGRVDSACDLRTPDEYARIYKVFYDYIKGVDPTAKLSNGPIIQPTPLRLEWLSRVWTAYQSHYGTAMPVDIWNVHNQMVKEAPSQGADYPLGIEISVAAALARNYGVQDNDRLAYFIEHIVAMRQWMKARGQQSKPLIISEYGILQPEYEGFTADRINAYMTATFTWLLYAKDASLGMPGDENRLVQRWAWFALNTPMGTGGQGGAWNGNLFDPVTRQITEHGRNFARFTCNTVKPTPTPGTTPLGSVITREAEQGNTHGVMARSEVQSASDCRFIYVPAGATITSDTEVVYNIYVPSTGDYVVWGRGWGVDYDNKSFNLAVGAYAWEPWDFGTGGNWTWRKATSTFRLEGNRWHTIKLRPRVGGQARMDMLIVTSDVSYNPNNVGGLIRVCNPTPTPTPTRTNTPTITPTPTVTRTPMPTGPAGIAGQIAFQGRGTAPSAAWQSPLVVSAHLPGDPIPAYQFNVLSSSAGYFQVPTGILTGTYDVGVRDANSLRNIKADVGLSVSSPHLNLGTLIEGDANLDRAVNILDFAILAGVYGASQGQTGWDARPDFNNDGTVNILDFSLLATNYGATGDRSVMSGASEPAQHVSTDPSAVSDTSALKGTVTLRVSPSTRTVAVGQEFDLDVYAAAGTQPFWGVECKLSFSTAHLQVLSLTTYSYLDWVVPDNGIGGGTYYSNSSGTISYAAGRTQLVELQGDVYLFRVRLKALQPIASTSVSFVPNSVKVTDLDSFLVGNAGIGGTVIILAASPTPTRTNTPVTTPVPSPTATNTPGAGVTEIVLRQGTDGYSGFVDTYIDSWNPTVSYHTDSHLKIRQPDVRRILIKSDVTMLSPGTIIDKATLTLYQTSGGHNTMTARLHKVLRPWVAPHTTWNAYAENVPWAQAGCGAAGTDRATALAFEREVFPTWGSFAGYPFDSDVTGLVQGWVNDPANNQGLIMVNGAGAATEIIFGSSDYGNESLRPKLVIWHKAGSAITPTPTATVTATPDAGGVVQGVVYVDLNTNGAADAGEGVAGATIRLRSQSDPSLDRTTHSGADGHYRFEGLAAATYRVQLITAPAGYAIVDDAAYLVPAGPGIPPYDADFQVRALPGGGRISLPLILRRS